MSDLKELVNKRVELIKLIKATEVDIKNIGSEISKYSPFTVGETLTVNDWSHEGKDFKCENITVTTAPKSAFRERIDGEIYFKAEGRVILKSGKLGKMKGQRTEKVRDFVD